MKRIIALLLAAMMLLALCACGSTNTETAKTTETDKPAAAQSTESAAEAESEAQATTQIVVDALGREVEVPLEVNRIVALSNVPRMVVFLGLADKVVGYSGMDPEKVTPQTAYAYATKELWADVPIVGTDAAGNTDYYPEQIISVQPDVILCGYAQDDAEQLAAQTGIPVVSVSMGTLFQEDYNEALRLIAKVCGVEDRAEEVITYVNDCLEDLDTRTRDIPDEEKPSCLAAAATFKGAHGIEGVRMNDQILAAVNAKDVTAGQVEGVTSMEVDLEQILAWNPDFIFCDYGGVKLVQNNVAENPDFYAQLKAFNNNQIYQYPSSTSYYSNLEIPLANCYFVGKLLYPEQFADIDVTEKANEIFKFFLGADNYMEVLEDTGSGYTTIDFGNNG